MRRTAPVVVALLCICLKATITSGQDDASATVTTTFNLYGQSIEPFDNSKSNALKAAIAQSAGHGVTSSDVQISVDKSYSDQQQSGRRLMQNGNLVQPGVQVTSTVQTTQSSAGPVASSIDNALASTQIAQQFNQQGSGAQADYTTVVTASSTNGNSGSSGNSGSGSSNNGASGSNNSASGSNNSSGGSGGKSSFPGWVIAVIVVLVLLLIGVVVGVVVWKKRAASRARAAQEFQAPSYFNDPKPTIGSKLSDIASGTGSSISGFFDRFKRAPPTTGLTSPTPAEGTSGLIRNPTTPFSAVGFGGSPGVGATSPGLTRSGSGGGDRYSGFVTRGPTTPKGSSIPNPLYTAPPKPTVNAYTPRRAGRLESLKDIENI